MFCYFEIFFCSGVSGKNVIFRMNIIKPSLIFDPTATASNVHSD